VEEFKRNFTKREIEKANEARRLFIIMGRPSQKVFEDMIKNGKLINNTVTVQDC
jgi:predicted lactoylglutathione lyase